MRTYEIGDIENVVFCNVGAVNAESEMFLLLLQALSAESLLLGCCLLDFLRSGLHFSRCWIDLLCSRDHLDGSVD